MSYNGSGTFQINTSGQPVVAGTVISSTAFNALTADLATGLSTAITKDGQTTTTARIPFAAGISSTLTTDSSSVSTGSIITAGGIGAAKAAYIGTTLNVGGASTFTGAIAVDSVTDSSSTTTGSIQTDGGLGVAKAVYVGTTLNVAGATTAASGSFTSLSDSGNLTFTGTGNRITGDFSNATFANRVAFQTSTTNGATTVLALPNGTGTTASWDAYNNSDPTNSSYLGLSALSTEARLSSTIRGTGTYLPMTFYTNGSERMRIDTSGNVGIGTSSPNGLIDVASNSNSTVRYYFRNANAGTGAYTILDLGNDTSNTRGELFVTSSGNTSSWGANSLVLSNSGAFPILFSTNNAERMRIDSSGNLLVGTTSSNGRLSVDSAGATSATYAVYVRNSTPSDLLYIRSDGFFSTGGAASSPYNATTATAANVVVASNGQLQRSTSSLKYKTDVHDATHGLVDLLKLRSVTYKGKNNGDTIFGGLIAEEVDAAGLTEFVQYADDGTPDALAYGNMVSLCIKAIQEQQALIQQLQADIATLKGQK